MEKSYTYRGTRQLANEFADLAHKYMSPFNREGSRLKTFNPDKAEMHYRRALSIYEKLYGADSVEAAFVLVTIATDIYRSQKKFSEANDLFLRALPAYEKRAGSQQADIDLAKILLKYVDVLEDLHLKAEAKKTASRAKALLDKYSR
jgi:tetratricopeptide (TPR) repeat protein